MMGVKIKICASRAILPRTNHAARVVPLLRKRGLGRLTPPFAKPPCRRGWRCKHPFRPQIAPWSSQDCACILEANMQGSEPTERIIDQKTFWRAIGQRATGSTIVTACTADGPAGFLGLSATHVCAGPPTIMTILSL